MSVYLISIFNVDIQYTKFSISQTTSPQTPPPEWEGLNALLYSIVFEINMVKFKKVIEKDMFFGAEAETFSLAKQMRKKPTDAEDALWKILRKYRQAGYIFRRQHPVEFYIADFYCHRLKLVVEVDGDIHLKKEAQDHDEGRTGELDRFSIEVLRFTNCEVLENPELVTKKLSEFIHKQTKNLNELPPLTPGEGERGGEVVNR